MITFGNEELLADGREDLPRIIDIARPTRSLRAHKNRADYRDILVQTETFLPITSSNYSSSFTQK